MMYNLPSRNDLLKEAIIKREDRLTERLNELRKLGKKKVIKLYKNESEN